MGKEIGQQIWTPESAHVTRGLALNEATRLQQLADSGYFDRGARTIDIEQEVFIIDALTGLPLNVESFLFNNDVGVRPDTTVYTVEYDANGVTPVSKEGIRSLLASLQSKTTAIQKAVTAITNGIGILVPIGTAPLVGAGCRDLVLRDEQKRARYKHLEEATLAENPQKAMRIENPVTGEVLVDVASNLSAMTRCAATQLHVAYPTLKETLEAYNISIALAGPLVAMFGNSPYAAGIDTGLGSSRQEMLEQGEQKRGGLARPANSVLEHYRNMLNAVMPPFIVLDDQRQALALTYGATHMSTRLRLDEENGTSRVEIRFLDSTTPMRATQALILLLGAVEWFKGRSLGSYALAQKNFREGRKGIAAVLEVTGKRESAGVIGGALITLAKEGAEQLGIGALASDMLSPLGEEMAAGQTEASALRQSVQLMEKQGLLRREALIAMQVIRSKGALGR